MSKCPKCGEELEKGVAFCTNCGNKIASVCPKCGKTLEPGAKACSGCGAMFCTNCGEFVCEKPKPEVVIKTETVQVVDKAAVQKAHKDGMIEAFNFILNLDCLDESYSLLVSAAEEENIDVVNALLDAGEDVDQTDGDGDTALMRAAANGYNKLVKLLIDAEADVNMTNDSDESALSLARDNGNRYIVSLLRKAGADDDDDDDD